jgi:hypothetical protein
VKDGEVETFEERKFEVDVVGFCPKEDVEVSGRRDEDDGGEEVVVVSISGSVFMTRVSR